MQLAAGQGKSIVLLLALQILRRLFPDDYKRIMLLTANDVLKYQYDEIIRNHEIGDEIEIQYKPNFAELGDFDLYLVDEADWIIRNFALSFNDSNHTFQGLSKLVGKKFLMASATYSAFERDVLFKTMKVDRDDFQEFMSAKMAATGSDHEPNMSYYYAPSDDQVIKSI